MIRTIKLLVLIALALIIDGLVLSKLWEWFVTDTFGVTTISVAQATGIGVIKGYLWSKSDSLTNMVRDWDESDWNMYTFIDIVYMPLVSMAGGLLVVQFVN